MNVLSLRVAVRGALFNYDAGEVRPSLAYIVKASS